MDTSGHRNHEYVCYIKGNHYFKQVIMVDILEPHGERIAVHLVKLYAMVKTHGASQCQCCRPCQGVIRSKLEAKCGCAKTWRREKFLEVWVNCPAAVSACWRMREACSQSGFAAVGRMSVFGATCHAHIGQNLVCGGNLRRQRSIEARGNVARDISRRVGANGPQRAPRSARQRAEGTRILVPRVAQAPTWRRSNSLA